MRTTETFLVVPLGSDIPVIDGILKEVFRQEVYEYTAPDGRTFLYDVNKAKEFAKKYSKDNPQSGVVDIEGSGFTVDGILEHHPSIDINYAMSSITPSRLAEPIICMEWENGDNILIDGWHRIFFACILRETYAVAIKTLPMYKLSAEEVCAITISQTR